jgi:YggT family protein
MSYLMQAGAFLIDVAFRLYIFILMLRVLIQWTQALNFYHPLSRFVYSATFPLLKPLQKFMPRYHNVDTGIFLLIILFIALKTLLIDLLLNAHFSIGGILISSFAELLLLFIYVFIFSIIIEMILSWFNSDPYNPLQVFVSRLNAPLLKPMRNFIPPVGGLDLSPLAVVILLQLALILIVSPLMDLSKRL